MDISLISLLIFTIITILYFVSPSIGKPELTLSDLVNDESKANYYSKTLKKVENNLEISKFIRIFIKQMMRR